MVGDIGFTLPSQNVFRECWGFCEICPVLLGNHVGVSSKRRRGPKVLHDQKLSEIDERDKMCTNGTEHEASLTE